MSCSPLRHEFIPKIEQHVLDLAEHPTEGVADLHHFGAVLDGKDSRLLNWITDSGISVLVADNVAIEAGVTAVPAHHGGALMPLHEHCLFKLGIHIGKMWHLTPLASWLAAHGRTRFQLTAPPLRLTGAVGSPVTPIATV